MISKAARLAWRALIRFFDHHGPDRAAAVAYYTLLSLLPLLIFLISVGVALLGSFDAAYKGVLFLFRGIVVHMDERSLNALRGLVEHSVRFQWGGILLLAWTSKRIFASLMSALEAVFEVSGRGFLRGFLRGNLMAMVLVLSTGVALLASIAVTLVVAGFEGFLLRYATGSMAHTSLHTLNALLYSQVLPGVVSFAFFFLIYRVVPHRVMRARYAAIGALLATVLWESAKAGFAYYVRNLANYGLYGTFEGVIVLALWLELSVSIILYCGEVVALLVTPTVSTAPQ